MRVEIYSSEKVELISGFQIIPIKIVEYYNNVLETKISFLYLKEISKYKISTALAGKIQLDSARVDFLIFIKYTGTNFPRLIYKGKLDLAI